MSSLLSNKRIFQQTQYRNMIYDHQNLPSSSQQPAETIRLSVNDIPFFDPAVVDEIVSLNEDDDYVPAVGEMIIDDALNLALGHVHGKLEHAE